jgi:hypothetical protein
MVKQERQEGKPHFDGKFCDSTLALFFTGGFCIAFVPANA